MAKVQSKDDNEPSGSGGRSGGGDGGDGSSDRWWRRESSDDRGSLDDFQSYLSGASPLPPTRCTLEPNMTNKNSTAGDIASDICPRSVIFDYPQHVGVAEPTTDVEAQARQEPQRVEEDAGDIAGKRAGVKLFSLILAGIITAFLVPYLSHVLMIAATVLASILTCECCCANYYNLKPHVTKWAKATLVTLILNFVVQVIGIVIAVAVASTHFETEEDMLNSMYTSFVILGSVVIVLDVLALVFSGLFTWGRNCGAPSSSG